VFLFILFFHTSEPEGNFRGLPSPMFGRSPSSADVAFFRGTLTLGHPHGAPASSNWPSPVVIAFALVAAQKKAFDFSAHVGPKDRHKSSNRLPRTRNVTTCFVGGRLDHPSPIAAPPATTLLHVLRITEDGPQHVVSPIYVLRIVCQAGRAEISTSNQRSLAPF